jgi:hypothetical protein
MLPDDLDHVKEVFSRPEVIDIDKGGWYDGDSPKPERLDESLPRILRSE